MTGGNGDRKEKGRKITQGVIYRTAEKKPGDAINRTHVNSTGNKL